MLHLLLGIFNFQYPLTNLCNKKKISVIILIAIFPGLILFAQENRKVPSFEEVLSLKGRD